MASILEVFLGTDFGVLVDLDLRANDLVQVFEFKIIFC
jgi:hypothetical protein